jgi:galactokinase
MSDDRSTSVVGEFQQRYGRAPDSVFRAPGRVNVIGEHTDYNAGLVLPIAIEQATWVAAGRCPEAVVTGWSAQRGDGGSVSIAADAPPAATGWLGYAAGVVWALRDIAPLDGGLDLIVDSTVPVGAGLSSSAALECAVALAVAEFAGAEVDRLRLAQGAQRAEHEVVGAPVGLMDQAVSLLAEPATALLLDCRSLQTRHVPFAPAADGLALVVIDTQVRHAHATGGYAERRRECEQAADAIGVATLRDASPDQLGQLSGVLQRRARHVLSENTRVQQAAALLDDGDIRGLGPLLVQSHVSLRDDFEVSVAELDTAVDAALAAGAIGARMTGGGFGGAAIALIAADDVNEMAAAVLQAFAVARHRQPIVFEVAPAAGAARVKVE